MEGGGEGIRERQREGGGDRQINMEREMCILGDEIERQRRKDGGKYGYKWKGGRERKEEREKEREGEVKRDKQGGDREGGMKEEERDTKTNIDIIWYYIILNIISQRGRGSKDFTKGRRSWIQKARERCREIQREGGRGGERERWGYRKP